MAVKTRAVTVGTTATRLDGDADQADRHAGESFAFYNSSGVTVYIGGADVTSTNGAPVAASSWSPGFDLASDDAIYGIVATGTAAVRVLESGV